MEKLNNHIKSDKAKWIAVVVALVVMCALLAGCIAAVVTGKKPQDWGKKQTVDETANVQIATMEQNRMLLSVATTAAENGETQKTVTATVTPAGAYNDLAWTIEWKSGDGWATDKNITDYITITASGNGNSTAIVTCKQAFGCTAILKATSIVQPDVFATCEIDYQAKLTTFDASKALKVTQADGRFSSFALTSSGWGISGCGDTGFKVDWSGAITTTPGTLREMIHVTKVEVKITEEAGKFFAGKNLSYAADYVPIYAQGATYILAPQMKSVFGFSVDEMQSESAQAVLKELLDYSRAGNDVISIRVTLTNNYQQIDGADVLSSEATFGLNIANDAFVQPANVALSPESLVF